MALQLEIVTPDRVVFKDTVDHVVIPTRDGGEIDVLPGHVPLMAMIEPGALQFFKASAADTIAIDRGFIQVLGDTIKVLTEAAIEVNKIDRASLDAARARAEEALREAQAAGADPSILEELETKARFVVIQKIVTDSKRR